MLSLCLSLTLHIVLLPLDLCFEVVERRGLSFTLALDLCQLAFRFDGLLPDVAQLHLHIIRGAIHGHQFASACLGFTCEVAKRAVLQLDAGFVAGDRTATLRHAFGKLTRFGKQPVNLTLKAYKNVMHPDAGPEWSVYAGISFLFPK